MGREQIGLAFFEPSRMSPSESWPLVSRRRVVLDDVDHVDVAANGVHQMAQAD